MGIAVISGGTIRKQGTQRFITVHGKPIPITGKDSRSERAEVQRHIDRLTQTIASRKRAIASASAPGDAQDMGAAAEYRRALKVNEKELADAKAHLRGIR